MLMKGKANVLGELSLVFIEKLIGKPAEALKERESVIELAKRFDLHGLNF
jgi:hypothetical protein